MNFFRKIKFLERDDISNHIVGVFVLEKNLKSQLYPDTLDTPIYEELHENEPVFQKDRSLPRNAAPLKEFLDENFRGF